MQEEVAKNFFFNKKSGPQCKRGIVMDIVKYNCVSDNFNLTCLLLFTFEDELKSFESLLDSLLPVNLPNP